MPSPDTGSPTGGSPTSTLAWPTVRASSTRFVWICRAGAIAALGYGLTVLLLAVGEMEATVWLWAVLAVGGIVHLAGVLGLWFLPVRTPRWLRSDAGGAAERTAARRALRSGKDLDDAQRRLVAVEVATTARIPVVAAVSWALLGPVLWGTPNTSHPLHWLGPATAAVVVLVLVALALQVRAIRRLQAAARRADALPHSDDEVSHLP